MTYSIKESGCTESPGDHKVRLAGLDVTASPGVSDYDYPKTPKDLSSNATMGDRFDLKQRPEDTDIPERRVATGLFHPMESLNGIVRRLDEGKAFIEFSKGDRVVHRSVALSTLKDACRHEIRPGDMVALRSYRSQHGIQTGWEYLGKATVKLSQAKLDELDRLHKRAYKKKN